MLYIYPPGFRVPDQGRRDHTWGWDERHPVKGTGWWAISVKTQRFQTRRWTAG